MTIYIECCKVSELEEQPAAAAAGEHWTLGELGAPWLEAKGRPRKPLRFECSLLRHLYLMNNQLQRLPETFGELKSLVHLGSRSTDLACSP